MVAELERIHSSPLGKLIKDKEADRAAVLKDYDEKTRRQAALYKANGVDERIVTGVDAISAATLTADLCGGDTRKPRNFLFFSRDQLRALGLEARQGAPSDDPVFINGRLAAMGRDFIACRAPDDFLSMKP